MCDQSTVLERYLREQHTAQGRCSRRAKSATFTSIHLITHRVKPAHAPKHSPPLHNSPTLFVHLLHPHKPVFEKNFRLRTPGIWNDTEKTSMAPALRMTRARQSELNCFFPSDEWVFNSRVLQIISFIFLVFWKFKKVKALVHLAAANETRI